MRIGDDSRRVRQRVAGVDGEPGIPRAQGLFCPHRRPPRGVYPEAGRSAAGHFAGPGTGLLDPGQQFADLGFTEIHVHNVGRNQAEFIEAFGFEVLPKLEGPS